MLCCIVQLQLNFSNTAQGLYLFKRHFLKGLFSRELIFGEGYYRREFCVLKWVGLDNKHSLKHLDNSIKELKQLTLTACGLIFRRAYYIVLEGFLWMKFFFWGGGVGGGGAFYLGGGLLLEFFVFQGRKNNNSVFWEKCSPYTCNKCSLTCHFHSGYTTNVLARRVSGHPVDAHFLKKFKKNSLNLL